MIVDMFPGRSLLYMPWSKALYIVGEDWYDDELPGEEPMLMKEDTCVWLWTQRLRTRKFMKEETLMLKCSSSGV